jgi:hypothetical protein
MRSEGYTRDISPCGVFVLTSDRLPSGAALDLEVALPSLRGQRTGARLRMQLPKTPSSEQSFSNGNGGGTHEAESKETKHKFLYFVPGSSA